MTLNDLQRAALVLFAAREGGPEASLDQLRALCHVVRNRVQAGWTESFLESTLMAETMARQDAGTPWRNLSVSDRRLSLLARDVDEIYLGQAGDEIAQICGRIDKQRGPVLYWAFIDRPINDWFRDNIVRKPDEHKQRAQVGHSMYLYE